MRYKVWSYQTGVNKLFWACVTVLPLALPLNCNSRDCFAACEGTLRLSVCPLPHSHQFGFVSNFELRISDFRLRRAALSPGYLSEYISPLPPGQSVDIPVVLR